MQDFDPVTVLDLQCLDLDKLGEVCKDWGLFRSVDHDVPVTLLNQLQDLARKLLSLSFESKQALFTSPNFLLLNQLSHRFHAGDQMLDTFSSAYPFGLKAKEIKHV